MRSKNPELKGLGRFGSRSIDMLSLAVALAWLAAMIGFSWWAGGDAMFAWLIRGMWGAIFIYALTFLTLHAAVLKVRSLEEETSTKEEKEETEQNPLEELQAAESGQLARMIAENVIE
jgi:fatty acid desaturase